MNLRAFKIPYNVKEKIGRNIYLQDNHPICIIKEKIYNIIGFGKEKFENIDPYVSVKSNFDDLLIPIQHPSRSKSDTFYRDENTVLRTHTSAHQSELISKGHKNFLVTGDVYRRDEIDAFHYPVFHQMEGVTIYDSPMSDEAISIAIKSELGMLITSLFPNSKYRWVESYFPFTDMSEEIEVFINDKWVEVLGCGKIKKEILENCGLKNSSGWAFGLGLERLAMILFSIPDIRYFWTENSKFNSQFKKGEINEFKPYSQYPYILRDVSFFYHDGFNKNDFFEILNTQAKDLVANAQILEDYHNPKTGRKSYLFRVVFESLERTLTNEEVNTILESVKNTLQEEFDIEMR